MQNQATNNSCPDSNKWQEIIDDWSKIGESQKKYCDRLELNLNKFTYERSKLLNENKKNPFVHLSVKHDIQNSMGRF